MDQTLDLGVNFKECDNYFNSVLKFKHKKDKYKPIKPNTKLQILFGKRNQSNSKYYFTTNEPTKEKLDYDLPVRLPKICDKIVETLKREKFERNKEKYANHKSFLLEDIRDRIRVSDFPKHIETIIDIDPDFYTIIEGRPIKNRCSLKKYVEELKESAFSNLQSGYLHDEILRFDEIFFKEQEKYKHVCKKFNQCVDNFENYLSEDYNRAKKKLEESSKISNEVMKKNEELKTLNIKHGIIVRNVYILEEKCRLAKMYQEFLDQISPLNWQNKDFFNNSNSRLEPIQEIRNTMLKYQVETVGDNVPSLSSLITIFKNAFYNNNEPELFFTEPWQIKKIFNRIETQNLANWSNSEELNAILEDVIKNLTHLKQSIIREFDNMKESIDILTVAIEREEIHADKLKDNIIKIISSDFHDTIASEETLKCNVCIKDVYDKLIFKNLSFSSYEMLKTLEAEYEENMIKLDYINAESVKMTQKLCYTEDLKIMKMAQDAAKQLKNLEKLYVHLKNSFI